MFGYFANPQYLGLIPNVPSTRSSSGQPGFCPDCCNLDLTIVGFVGPPSGLRVGVDTIRNCDEIVNAQSFKAIASDEMLYKEVN